MALDPAIRRRRVVHVDAHSVRTWTEDDVVVEAPLELRASGRPLIVMMRTPGHDRELARGLLFGEGLIDAGEPLHGLDEPEGLPAQERGNVLETGLPVDTRTSERSLPAMSGCGVCGKRSIAELELRAGVVESALEIPASLVAALPARLRAAQEVFERTGGLHAAGAFDRAGRLLALREDVGRHNAVDKLVGWALSRGRVPLAQALLCVSGRIGFEIVQKAIVAGVPVIVAVSAPSSLAIDLAERFRVTLCGFARGGRFNIYSHESRITDEAPPRGTMAP